MNTSKRNFLNLTRRDIGLVLGIGTLAAILNVYPYPLIAAGAVVIGILLSRFTEKEVDKKSELPGQDDRTIEKRSAEEIITDKLNKGAIEQAIDQQFDAMIQDVVRDLFGNYGDLSQEIKKKLKETMNPYIEKYDFDQHAVKLEHLLNQIITETTKEQDSIIRKFHAMMETTPISEITSSQLFEKFSKYISENIETDDLEINYDDEPSYQYLTASLETEDKKTYSDDTDAKTLTFFCEEDSDMNIRVGIRRWTSLSDKAWYIESIERVNSNEHNIKWKLQDDRNLTTMETPITHLRDLTELEVYLLKLYYNRSAIVLDETDICDDAIEVDAEPEAYLA